MKKKNKIMVSSWGFPDKSLKNGNTYLLEYVTELSKYVNEVILLHKYFVSPLSYLKIKFNGGHFYKPEGVKTKNIYIINYFAFLAYRFPILQKINIRLGVFWGLFFYFKFNKKPDILEQHFILNGNPDITNYINKKFNIPYVLIEHSHNVRPVDINRRKGSQFSDKDIYKFVKNAKLRFAKSERFKMEYEETFKVEFEEVPNFLPDSFFNTNIKKKDSDEFVFLIIGSLINRKNQSCVIRAFSKFNKLQKSKLIIVGRGPNEKTLKDEVVDYDLVHCVEFINYLNRMDILQIINSSNVVVVNSVVETFGMTIIESFTRGRPVLSVKCGGPESIINDNNGILVNFGEENLYNGMCEIFTKYNLFIPDKIAEDAQKRYSSKAILPTIIKKYENII